MSKALKFNKLFFIVSFLICFFYISTIFTPQANAAASDRMAIQGKIVDQIDGTNITNTDFTCILAGADTCDFRVNIYDGNTGGATLLWREPHTNVEIGDKNGIFSLSLNSVCANWLTPSGSCSGSGIIWGSDSTIYISIEVDTDGNGDFTSGVETFPNVATNRPLLNTVPFSYYSDTAGALANGLDSAYDSDSNQILAIDNAAGLEFASTVAGNISFDLQSTGGLIFQDNNSTFFTVNDLGGFDWTLDAVDNPNFLINNLGTGSFTIADQAADTSVFIVDATGNVGIGTSTTNAKLDLVASTTNDAIQVTSSSTGQGLNIIYTGAGTTTNALNIENTSTGPITNAINVSDVEIVNAINLGANNIVSTDGQKVSWNDSAGNELIRIEDLSTNFGAMVYGGAFGDLNSTFQEEFNRWRATVSPGTAAALSWGDTTAFTAREQLNTTNDCSYGTATSRAGGVSRMTNIDATASCLLNFTTTAIATIHSPFDADNLPVLLMKASPQFANATNLTMIGLGDTNVATTAAPVNGIYFSNEGGADWVGVTRSGNVQSTVACGVSVATSPSFNLLRIEVVSTSEVRFYVDNNIGNGISWTSCGSTTTNIPTFELSSMIKWSSTTINRYLDVDYYRVWQDDAPIVPQVVSNIEAQTTTNQDTIEEITQSNPNSSQLDEVNNQAIQQIENMTQPNKSLNKNISVPSYPQNLNSETNSQALINQPQETQNNTPISELSPYLTPQGQSTGLIFTNESGAVIISGDASFNITKLKFEATEVEFTARDILINAGVRINGNVDINGDLAISGSLYLSKNNSGSFKIPAGLLLDVEILFNTEKASEPIIQLTPINDKQVNYILTEKTKKGFKVRLLQEYNSDIKFDWIALDVRN